MDLLSLITYTSARILNVRGELGGFTQIIERCREASVFGALRRERQRIRAEISSVQGLMPLLMKRRNGEPWTTEERTELRTRLRSLSSVVPYLAVAMLPGSSAFLPIMAWWLDQRRRKRMFAATG